MTAAMGTRVAFVHTVGFLVETFRALMKDAHPDTDTFHILNESLLRDLLRGDEPALVHRRVVDQLLLAVDAGADIVVMTCSSTSPGVDVARRLVKVPILKIDDPMAAEAVRLGTRIGLLCTAESTIAPSTALLRAHAFEQAKEIGVVPSLAAAAYTALMAQDRATHDRLVREAAQRLAPEVDVVVLAQASLAGLQESLGAELRCPVLASPPLLMRELGRRLS